MSGSHIIRPGECLASLAEKHGFAHWREIYEHPNNAKLRELRPNPLVLAPGDEIFIPPVRPNVMKLESGKTHTIMVLRPKVSFRALLRDCEGQPLTGKNFRLDWDTGKFEGTTTSEGYAECPIPIEVQSAQLVVWLEEAGSGDRFVWDVRIGHLDPVELPIGARQRLNNLGYFAGRGEAAEMDDELRFALRAFQEDESLSATGEIDAATQVNLVIAHGNV